MQTLSIDPPVPLRVPPGPIAVLLVGCGGTGSHLAQHLARLASHLRDVGPAPLYLSLVDGDHVEAKNVGRQLFSPAEVGRNKAQALAARLNAAFGLRITALPEMATASSLASPGGHSCYRIVVGAVDGAEGRQAIAANMAAFDLWIDCGNHEHDGQVVLGTTADKGRLARAFAIGGMCSALPAPHLQLPQLLDAPTPARGQDCAAAVQDNAQSFQINAAIAAVAAQYVAQIAIGRQLTHFQTWLSLSGMAMRSTPITAAAVAAATAKPKKKGRKAA